MFRFLQRNGSRIGGRSVVPRTIRFFSSNYLNCAERNCKVVGNTRKLRRAGLIRKAKDNLKEAKEVAFSGRAISAHNIQNVLKL